MFRVLALCLLGLCCTCAFAVEHPAWSRRPAASQLAALKTKLAPLLALPEADLLKLVPAQSGLYFVGCPNCQGGMQEAQLSKWDYRQPDRVACAYCGHVYPSDKYPSTGSTKVTAPDGAAQAYPYHESRPAWWHGQEPYRSYFQARVDYHKLHFMEDLALDFARAYALSDDEAYGRCALRILTRFAEVYPGYCYHFDYPFQQKVIYSGEVAPKDFRPGFRTARWSWWAYMDISMPLLEAYDLLAGSPVWQQAGAGGPAVERMLTMMTEQVVANRDDLSNMSPGMWADVIAAGRVLGRPEWVHTAVGRLRRMMTEMFFYDGSWQEGAPSYHSQVVGALSAVINSARGYSDPAGYQDPGDGRRFENLDLERDLPELVRARSALLRMRLPNGRYLPVHDTWSTNGAAPLTESKPDLLGGLGQGLLGFGQGADMVQVGLTWSPGYGHIHYDGLALLVFAKGKELLSDLGYTHTRAREWTIQSASHNTVVVDHANQAANHDTQGLVRYFHADDNLQVLSVDNPQVYPGVTSLYRRTVALVRLGAGDGYVVDLFGVKGGRQHDYFLHGSADDPQTLTVPGLGATPLASLVPPGVSFTPAAGEGEYHGKPGEAYGYLSNLSEYAVPADTLAEVDYQTTGQAAGLRVFSLIRAGDRLITGTNPAVRGARSDDGKLEQCRRQFALLRRAGGESLFASVLAPYGERQAVRAVRLVPLPGAELALEVEALGRRDLLIVGARGARGTWLGHELQATAELALLRHDGDNFAYAGAVGGGLAVAEGPRMQGAERLETKLLGVQRQGGRAALIVDATGPEPGLGAGATGRWVVVDHAGQRTSVYRVTGYSAEQGRERLELADDPGFDYDAQKQTTHFVTLPGTDYTGKHTVSLCPFSGIWLTKGED